VNATTTQAERLLAVDLCVGGVTWSAERAVPMQIITSGYDERAEFFVDCLLASAGDCASALACTTPRNPAITCQEDGCSSKIVFDVTCDGDIATLANGMENVARDCSRALAKCSTESPTGCTDRQPLACPSDGGRADTCDGNVRLGCDGADQVSYRDCERLGGICADAAAGGKECNYGPADAECTGSQPLLAACSNGVLAACVTGRRLEIDAAVICGSL
jgi:hypothetical protein